MHNRASSASLSASYVSLSDSPDTSRPESDPATTARVPLYWRQRVALAIFERAAEVYAKVRRVRCTSHRTRRLLLHAATVLVLAAGLLGQIGPASAHSTPNFNAT